MLRIAKLTLLDAEGAISHSSSLADRPEPGAAVSLRCRVQSIMPLACSSRIRAKRQSQARGGPGIFRLYCPLLSLTGALSHAIYVSDFQDLCYRCSWFPKRPRARPEARWAWIAGRPLRSRRGSVLIARRYGGAPSHVDARRAGRRGSSRREKRLAISQFGSAPKALKKARLRKKETWSSFPLALNSFLMIWIFLPLALEILPRTLSSTRLSAWNSPRCLSRSSSCARPARRPSPQGGARRSRCVNAVDSPEGDPRERKLALFAARQGFRPFRH